MTREISKDIRLNKSEHFLCHTTNNPQAIDFYRFMLISEVQIFLKSGRNLHRFPNLLPFKKWSLASFFRRPGFLSLFPPFSPFKRWTVQSSACLRLIFFFVNFRGGCWLNNTQTKNFVKHFVRINLYLDRINLTEHFIYTKPKYLAMVKSSLSWHDLGHPNQKAYLIPALILCVDNFTFSEFYPIFLYLWTKGTEWNY